MFPPTEMFKIYWLFIIRRYGRSQIGGSNTLSKADGIHLSRGTIVDVVHSIETMKIQESYGMSKWFHKIEKWNPGARQNTSALLESQRATG